MYWKGKNFGERIWATVWDNALSSKFNLIKWKGLLTTVRSPYSDLLLISQSVPKQTQIISSLPQNCIKWKHIGINEIDHKKGLLEFWAGALFPLDFNTEPLQKDSTDTDLSVLGRGELLFAVVPQEFIYECFRENSLPLLMNWSRILSKTP